MNKHCRPHIGGNSQTEWEIQTTWERRTESREDRVDGFDKSRAPESVEFYLQVVKRKR
jgi:hypothetical protein